MKRIFLSGAVSNRPYTDAWYHFANMYRAMSNNTTYVWNPMFHCSSDWCWLHCMVVCLWNLSKCDSVLFLHGWKGSRGARIEHAFAKLLGKELLFEYVKE